MFVLLLYDRRGSLQLGVVFSVVGSVLLALTSRYGSYELVISRRFLVGFHSGWNTVAVPLYLSEIAPLNMRGALTAVPVLVPNLWALISHLFVGWQYHLRGKELISHFLF